MCKASPTTALTPDLADTTANEDLKAAPSNRYTRFLSQEKTERCTQIFQSSGNSS